MEHPRHEKFLRGLVEQLSKNNSARIVEVIREIEKPWRQYPWYGPYVTWTSGISNTIDSGSITLTNGSNSATIYGTSSVGANTVTGTNGQPVVSTSGKTFLNVVPKFSDIKTF